MTRRVIVEMEDGSVQPVENVPDNITNEQVAKRYGGRIMGTGEDIGRSALSAGPFAATQALTAIPKALTGAGIGLGFDEALGPIAKGLHRGETSMLGATGGGYAPRTKAGEYTKSITAGAIPIPGLGPVGAQAALGGLSGLIAQGSSDLGLESTTGAAASMLPFLLAAGYKGAQPAAPARNTRAALDNLMPEERATMEHRMRVAKENNLPLMPWQAAPEGSDIRNLGVQVAGSKSSYPVRSIQGRQALEVTGNPDLIPRAPPATSRISSPKYEKSAEVPVKSETVGQMHDAILAIKTEKKLAPNSPQSKVIDKIAEQLGRYEEVPVNERIDRLTELRDQMEKGSPQHKAIQNEILNVVRGTAFPEQRFVPADISNYGQIQNIYQNPRIPNLDAGVNVDTATKLWVRNAIAKVADADNPLFAAARKSHRDVSDLIKSVEATDKRGSGGLNAASEAKVELAPDFALALSANPLWATVGPIRDWMAKRSVKEYNKGFASTDMQDLLDLAKRNPRAEMSKSLINAILAPVKQGEFYGLFGEE